MFLPSHATRRRTATQASVDLAAPDCDTRAAVDIVDALVSETVSGFSKLVAGATSMAATLCAHEQTLSSDDGAHATQVRARRVAHALAAQLAALDAAAAEGIAALNVVARVRAETTSVVTLVDTAKKRVLFESGKASRAMQHVSQSCISSFQLNL